MVSRNQEEYVGHRLAQIGADIEQLEDDHWFLDNFSDYRQMMFLINKLSYRLIHGKERDLIMKKVGDV